VEIGRGIWQCAMPIRDPSEIGNATTSEALLHETSVLVEGFRMKYYILRIDYEVVIRKIY
jgi:hypothetical protein